MKKQHYLALGRHRITLIGKLYRGSQLHETKFNCNECNFTFVKLYIFNTHMKRQRYLALGRHRITLRGKLYQWNKFNCNKCISIFVQFQKITITFTKVEFKYKNNEKQKIPYSQRDQRISSWTNWNRPHIYIQKSITVSWDLHTKWNLNTNIHNCNIPFVNLNRLNTHMKRQHYLALGRHRITFPAYRAPTAWN